MWPLSALYPPPPFFFPCSLWCVDSLALGARAVRFLRGHMQPHPSDSRSRTTASKLSTNSGGYSGGDEDNLPGISAAPSPTNRRRIKPTTTVDQSHDGGTHRAGGGGRRGARGHRRSVSPLAPRRLEPNGSPTGSPTVGGRKGQRRDSEGNDASTDWTIPENTARQKKPTRAQATQATGGLTKQRSPRAERAPTPPKYGGLPHFPPFPPHHFLRPPAKPPDVGVVLGMPRGSSVCNAPRHPKC